MYDDKITYQTMYEKVVKLSKLESHLGNYGGGSSYASKQPDKQNSNYNLFK